MTAHPFLVAGPERFDTAVMQAGAGRIVAKGGAEGYQGMGIRPDALFKGSPALGITFKVIDGDQAVRANGVIATAILDQLGLFRGEDHPELAPFQARRLYNGREIEIGEIRAAFRLDLPDEYLAGATA